MMIANHHSIQSVSACILYPFPQFAWLDFKLLGVVLYLYSTQHCGAIFPVVNIFGTFTVNLLSILMPKAKVSKYVYSQ